MCSESEIRSLNVERAKYYLVKYNFAKNVECENVGLFVKDGK
jgi:hypothetical protein